MIRLLILSALLVPAVAAQGAAAQDAARTAETDSIPTAEVSLSFSLRSLLVPVEGVVPADLDNTFTARRSGGRTHRAIDIMAPRGTPVLAVSDGEIVRVGSNRLGGKTLTLRAADGSHDFYYAHLHSYSGLAVVGTTVRQGDVLGTVGNTGNARRTPPHLHFQALRRNGTRRGRPVNPYTLFQRSDLYGRSVRG